MSSDKRPDRIYVSWPSGPGGELRVVLTVRYGKPIIDIRFGELGREGWRPSSRGVAIPLRYIEALQRALRQAVSDSKRFDLIKTEYTSTRIRQRPPRRG